MALTYSIDARKTKSPRLRLLSRVHDPDKAMSNDLAFDAGPAIAAQFQRVPMEDPPTILQRIAESDRAAVDECIDRYTPLVVAIAKRYVSNHAAVEDSTQEIFLEIWCGSSRFDSDHSREATFIAMIARRRSIDLLWKSTSEKAVETVDGFEAGGKNYTGNVDSIV